jgi:membrane-associated protease RseP (regulator of RpoE activity)
MAKKPWWQQVAVMGAGSTSNFIFGFLFLFLFLFVVAPFANHVTDSGDITFTNVMNESSLYDYGITNGTLTSFNGVSDSENILLELREIEINKTYNLSIINNAEELFYEVNTFENPLDSSRAMIGISGIAIETIPKSGFEFLGTFPNHLLQLFFWIWFLNIAIGVMNLLPIWITDGGQIFRILAVKYFGERKGLFLNNFVSWISVLLIIFTIWPSLLLKILGIF